MLLFFCQKMIIHTFSKKRKKIAENQYTETTLHDTITAGGDTMKGYQIKITIKGSRPPVWRRIQIPQDMTFHQLHDTIQTLFGWDWYHLHDFEIPKTEIRIGDLEYLDDDSILDEYEHCLFEIMNEGLRMEYTYDFGDCWVHTLLVEKEVNMEELYPVLVKWKGDNFVEDAPYGTEAPFDEETVRTSLKSYKLTELKHMSAEVSNRLDQAVTRLDQLLAKKTIGCLCLIVMETKDHTKYIGFNSMEGDTSLQIYDNQTDYLQGVDYVSSSSQGNLYANAVCMISTPAPLPVDSWKSSSGTIIIKKMRPGYLPMDLSDEEAKCAITDINNISEIIASWKKKTFPTYDTNECLYAKQTHQGWKISQQQIRLHANRTKVHLAKETIHSFETEAAHNKKQIKVDLISEPVEETFDYKIDMMLIIETSDDTYSDYLPQKSMRDFSSINHGVLEILCEYLYDEGIPDKILVNNENLRFMLSGLCEDLKINLAIEHFITKTQLELYDTFDSGDDMEILEAMANMNGEEFYDFIQNMDSEELAGFQEFLKKFIDLDELDKIFHEVELEDTYDDDDDSNHKKKTFDA